MQKISHSGSWKVNHLLLVEKNNPDAAIKLVQKSYPSAAPLLQVHIGENVQRRTVTPSAWHVKL